MADVSSSTIAALLRLGALPRGEWNEALQEILRADAELLDVERVSFWCFCDVPPSIACELGYVRSRALFEHGAVLRETEGGAYFAETRRVQLLTVEDASRDPRVAGIASYLERHRVGALLDVPVVRDGEVVGILCHEHVGGPRQWAARECELALAVCGTLSARMEASARGDAEKAERRAAFLSRATGVLARTLDPEVGYELAVREAIPALGALAVLIGYDGTRVRRLAHAPREGALRAYLDEAAVGSEAGLEGPGLGLAALREGTSLLLPTIDAEALRAHGLDDRLRKLVGRLGVRSAMAVLLEARGRITGAFTFASTTRRYDHDDLRFAEAYARQVGVLLSNVELYVREQRAVRARDEFLSLASHELRTPLASLTLSAQLLAREMPADAPERTRRALEMVLGQTKRLGRLSELLLAASLEADALEPAKVTCFDLAEIVREAVRELEDAAARAGSALRVVAESPVELEGDPGAVKIVVSNLLDNALKFGAGRPVEVSVRGEAATARVVVRDRGPGLSPGLKSQLGRRFERGVSARHFGGLGLGLHVSSRIIDAHGGALRVASDPAEGSTFCVELPRPPRDLRKAGGGG